MWYATLLYLNYITERFDALFFFTHKDFRRHYVA